MRLFPRNYDFFRLFETQALELEKATAELKKLKRSSDLKRCNHEVKEIEHTADEITHQIMRTLNQTFITPIDREDIAYLASNLDSVVDKIDRAVNRLLIYKIDPLPKAISDFVKHIDKSVEVVTKSIKEMKHPKNHKEVLKACEAINKLEHDCDELHRRVIQKLFQEEKDPIMIIKLLEIYECLEGVTDRCEDVANTIETILVKNF